MLCSTAIVVRRPRRPRIAWVGASMFGLRTEPCDLRKCGCKPAWGEAVLSR